MRQILRIEQSLDHSLKSQLLSWASQFREVIWLDSNDIPHTHAHYRAILAVEAQEELSLSHPGSFDQLDQWQQQRQDWLFGYLGYDLKNEVEDLKSENPDGLAFPEMYFFRPKRLLIFLEQGIELHYLKTVSSQMKSDWEAIQQNIVEPSFEPNQVSIRVRTTPDQYRNRVGRLMDHIKRGDIYEANYCMEFYAKDVEIDPISTFLHLNELSAPPFSTFFRSGDHFALSASPERFLRKKSDQLISQPIKGTRKRGNDPIEDAALKKVLEQDPKERSENIMITDLVRNDLSRIAQSASVTVEELCQVYSFKQVHQLISTISCKLKADITPVQAIKAMFPMGSMTGAPKIRAMELIEELEEFKRGLYSGAIGYFSPQGDFDFNVIIRTILYNRQRSYLSLPVGSAITSGSEIDQEYAECLLKAKAMREVLE